jgi:hypothetical protein
LQPSQPSPWFQQRNRPNRRRFRLLRERSWSDPSIAKTHSPNRHDTCIAWQLNEGSEMRTTSKRVGYLITLLAILTAPQSARAGAKEEARKHYDRAIELIDDGQLAEAIVEFQRSYDLTKHFSVLYNIGQVYVSLAKPVEAIAAYEGYLVGGGRNIPVARRSEVEKEIARQKVRIATLVFRILPDGATVRLDGNEIGKAPISASVRVGLGTHNIAALAEGYDPAETEVTVAGEDQKVVELTLVKHVAETPPPQATPVVQLAPALPAAPAELPVPAASVPAAASFQVEPPTEQRSVSNTRIAGIASGAVGVAGIVVGTVCGLTAKSRHNEAMDNWSQNYDKAVSLQGQAQNFATAADIGFITGGALVALGVVLYIVGAPDAHAASETHALILPAAGPGFAGINAGGTW